MAVKKTHELEYAPPTKGGSFILRKDGSLQEIPSPAPPAPATQPAPAAPPLGDSKI